MDSSFDLKGFWLENQECFTPFSTNKPRVGFGLGLEDHFLINFIPMESTITYYTDPAFTIDIHYKANDILEREIGKRHYPEDNIYYVKGAFEVLMGTKRIIHERNTPWLESEVESIEDVKRLINYAEKWDAKKQSIPDDWRAAKERLKRERGKHLRYAFGTNGPATLACNMLGTTNLCYFIMDEPEVMDDFFEIMTAKYIEFYDVITLEDEGVVSKEGMYINDDDCNLIPPREYERFCAPFLKKLFDKYAPLPHHKRQQHSDSRMGHLMGILNDLGVNEVNLGPEIHPLDIRKAMPNAVICGHTPPFVLRDGKKEEIIDYVKRNFEMLGADGGYVECLAGVVPESTPLENMRTYMHAVHTYTRYR